MELATNSQCMLRYGAHTLDFNRVNPARLRIPVASAESPNLDQPAVWDINLCNKVQPGICPGSPAAYITEIYNIDAPECKLSFVESRTPRFRVTARGHVEAWFSTGSNANVNLTLTCGPNMDLRPAANNVTAARGADGSWVFDVVLSTAAACVPSPCIFSYASGGNFSNATHANATNITVNLKDVPQAMLAANVLPMTSASQPYSGLRSFDVNLCFSSVSPLCGGSSLITVYDGGCRLRFTKFSIPWTAAGGDITNGSVVAAATMTTDDSMHSIYVSLTCGATLRPQLLGNTAVSAYMSPTGVQYNMMLSTSAVCNRVPTPPAPPSISCSVVVPSGGIVEVSRVPQSAFDIFVSGGGHDAGPRWYNIDPCMPMASATCGGKAVNAYITSGRPSAPCNLAYTLASHYGWSWNETEGGVQALFATATQQQQVKLILVCGDDAELQGVSADASLESGPLGEYWLTTVVAESSAACAMGQRPTHAGRAKHVWQAPRVRLGVLLLLALGGAVAVYIVYRRRQAAIYAPLRPIVPFDDSDDVQHSKAGRVQAPTHF